MVVHEELPRLPHAARDRFENRLARLERRFLRDARELEPRCEPHLAVVRARDALDDLQQAGLARAVSPDEADVLARLDHEVRVVEQRNVAVGERDFGELDEWHRCRMILQTTGMLPWPTKPEAI